MDLPKNIKNLSLSLVTSISLLFFSLAQANTNDNTLDFSSSESTPNTQHTPRGATNQNLVKFHRAYDSFTWELGIGYVASWFNARQRFDEPVNGIIGGDDNSLAHGADLFFNGNYYIRDRFGWTFGVGMEFIDMKWKDGLAQINTYADIVETEKIKNEFLYDVYLHTGFFGDVWRKKNQSLRLFATIGVSIDFLFGGWYEKEVDECSGYVFCVPTYNPYDTKNKTISATLPIQLGARYYFAQNHGIEVFAKYHALSWNFTQSHINPNLKTNISRGASVGARYVFEYK